jgi:hypothetical protein
MRCNFGTSQCDAESDVEKKKNKEKLSKHRCSPIQRSVLDLVRGGELAIAVCVRPPAIEKGGCRVHIGMSIRCTQTRDSKYSRREREKTRRRNINCRRQEEEKEMRTRGDTLTHTQ